MLVHELIGVQVTSPHPARCSLLCHLCMLSLAPGVAYNSTVAVWRASVPAPACPKAHLSGQHWLSQLQLKAS